MLLRAPLRLGSRHNGAISPSGGNFPAKLRDKRRKCRNVMEMSESQDHAWKILEIIAKLPHDPHDPHDPHALCVLDFCGASSGEVHQ